MYNCKQVQDCINEYLDDFLSLDEKVQVVQHLESCADCKREVDLLLSVKSSLAQIQQMPAPLKLRSSVMAEIRTKSKVHRPFFMHYKVYSPVLAAFVLMFLFRISAVENYVAITEPMVTSPVATQVIIDPQQTPNVGMDASGANEAKSTNEEPKAPQNTKATATSAQKNAVKPKTSVTYTSTNVPKVTPKPQDTAVVTNPESEVPVSSENNNAVSENNSENSTSMSLSSYAPNPDQYDKHVLRVKRSAVSGLTVFRVGMVSDDYFDHMKQNLDSSNYTEEFIPVKTGAPLGDLYFIVLE